MRTTVRQYRLDGCYLWKSFTYLPYFKVSVVLGYRPLLCLQQDDINQGKGNRVKKKFNFMRTYEASGLLEMSHFNFFFKLDSVHIRCFHAIWHRLFIVTLYALKLIDFSTESFLLSGFIIMWSKLAVLIVQVCHEVTLMNVQCVLTHTHRMLQLVYYKH